MSRKGPVCGDFLSFDKFLHYFLQEITYNYRVQNTLFSLENAISGKILLRKLNAKVLSSNQIAGFFDYKHLWKDWINISIFLIFYMEIFFK